MHHTCPHCSARFDQQHDFCPSCNRSMFKTSWWMTLLKAIFQPKQRTMTSRYDAGIRPTRKSKVTTTQRFAFDDGTGMREWSNWDDVPPEIQAKIESFGGGPRIKEGELTTRRREGRIDLADLPPDLRKQLEELRGDAEFKTVEISGSTTFQETERRRGDVLIDRSSRNTAKYRYEDSDGTVHEADRFEDLPPHVQALIRGMSGIGGE